MPRLPLPGPRSRPLPRRFRSTRRPQGQPPRLRRPRQDEARARMTAGDPGAKVDCSRISPSGFSSPLKRGTHMRQPKAATLVVVAALLTAFTVLAGAPLVTGVSAQAGTPELAAADVADDRIRGWIEAA